MLLHVQVNQKNTVEWLHPGTCTDLWSVNTLIWRVLKKIYFVIRCCIRWRLSETCTNVLFLSFLNLAASASSVGGCYCFIIHRVSRTRPPAHINHSLNAVDALTKPQLYIYNDLLFILHILTAILGKLSSWLSPVKEKYLLLFNHGKPWKIYGPGKSSVRKEDPEIVPGKEA